MILAAILLQAAALAQPPVGAELGALAEVARRAFATREFRALLDEHQPVRLELPDGRASVSVRGRVAAASLTALMRRTIDRELVLVGAAVEEGGRGYVELRRRFRIVGTQEDQAQRILIAATLEEGVWRVAEVWVSATT